MSCNILLKKTRKNKQIQDSSHENFSKVIVALKRLNAHGFSVKL